MHPTTYLVRYLKEIFLPTEASPSGMAPLNSQVSPDVACNQFSHSALALQ